MPNGTAGSAAIRCANNSDPTNAAFVGFDSTTTEVRVTSGITGTGTYLPMTFYTGGSERMRMDTSGNTVVTGALSATSNITSTATNPYFVGSSATAGIIYYGSTGAASSVQTLVNNTQITTVSSTGLAVNGGLSTTQSVTATAGFVIGNDNSY